MLKKIKANGRLQTIIIVSLVFLGINFITRLVLTGYEEILQGISYSSMPGIFIIGFIYDLASLTYAIIPFLLLAVFTTSGRWGRWLYLFVATTLFVLMIAVMLFVSVSEFIFWDEFTSRFNFIAVDYLVYTREVLGNIRESYPVGWVFTGIGIGTMGIVFLLRKKWLRSCQKISTVGDIKWVFVLMIFLFPVLSYTLVGDGLRARLQDNIDGGLASNGYYEFLRAFRNNDLDFNAFYRTLPIEQAEAIMKEEFEEGTGAEIISGHPGHTFPRVISGNGPEKYLNVILVSIESLGSDYVESFGGRPGLTPALDNLAAQGLMMTRVYATGLRTVRGLEALSLSIPPTPGRAVIKRKKNKGLQTIGSIFRSKGYDALYIYGGYSYFDNMSNFFSGNGYEVIDRTDIDEKNISHENVWGVADEDIFHKTISEIDKRVSEGKKVFAHVMTTSNHRPFTYPDGRVDIPSGSSREGAVQYTDWAVGNFIKEASTREWFEDTLFVFVADHTSNGRGHSDLPPKNYEIPLIFYSPKHVKPGKLDYIMSQIDVVPTLLGLLDFNYESDFFGEDMIREQGRHQRALMANYLTVGYMEDDVLVELLPGQRVKVRDAKTNKNLDKNTPKSQHFINEAISYYEMATDILHGMSAE